MAECQLTLVFRQTAATSAMTDQSAAHGACQTPSHRARHGPRRRDARLSGGAIARRHGAAAGVRIRQRSRRRGRGNAALRASGRGARRQGVTASAGLGDRDAPAAAPRSGAGYADGRRRPGRRRGGRGSRCWSIGCGSGPGRRAASPRSAPGRFCWRPRACWTAGARPHIGRICAELARRFPAVRVESDPIFVRDGAVWTSAGVTAGIDLALALVEAGSRPHRGARGGALSGGLPQASGRAGAVQRRAVPAGGGGQIRRAA